MTEPATLREAMLLEALGEAARLIQQLQALGPMLERSCEVLVQTDAGLREQLAGIDSRVEALSVKARTRIAEYLPTRADESARTQSKAMADAARVAFGAQVGAALQQLQASQVRWERAGRRLESWMTHGAAVGLTSVFWIGAWLWWGR